MLSGAQVVYNSLLRQNIKYVFGYSGGAILPLTDQFYNNNIKYIMNRNEACVGHAAEGYAKSSGKVGVIVTTSGPGVTNLITPLQDALYDGVPLVAITGQVPTFALNTNAFQEAPAIELTRPCTKANFQPTSADELADVMDLAFDIATTGRKGPVHIDIPKDVLVSETSNCNASNGLDASNALDTSNYNDFIETSTYKVLLLKQMIEKSMRPIMIVGQGAIDSSEYITDIAKYYQIPITTTLHGMGIFDERHPLALEMLGMHGSAYANFAVQNSDLIIAIGTRFDDRTTGNVEKYAPNAKIVHFDIDKKQINFTIPCDLSLVGDCNIYLKELHSQMDKKPNTKSWLNKIAKWKTLYPFAYKKTSNLKTQQVIEEINTHLDNKDFIITTGVGNHQMMSCQYIKWRKPRSIVSSGSLGVMGFGLPAAIGAQLANPKSLVLCIDGDSSFMMTLNDLATIKEHNLPIKIFIMNDSRQQMVYVWQKLFFNERYISTCNVNPDFCKIADAFGIPSIKISHQDDFKLLPKVLNTNTPYLINCIVEPDMCTPLVPPGKALDEMIMNTDGDLIIDGMAPN